MHFRDLQADLKGSLSDVPLHWQVFVSAIVGEENMEEYNQLHDKRMFRSVLVSLICRKQLPLTKLAIYDTLNSSEVGLHDIASEWKRKYMVSVICVSVL